MNFFIENNLWVIMKKVTQNAHPCTTLKAKLHFAVYICLPKQIICIYNQLGVGYLSYLWKDLEDYI